VGAGALVAGQKTLEAVLLLERSLFRVVGKPTILRDDAKSTLGRQLSNLFGPVEEH
jgi:hypothetical protein